MIVLKNLNHTSPTGRPILLDIFYQSNSKKKPVILFSHGYKSFKDWGCFDMVASFFAENSFIFIKFNYSHNGVTEDNGTYISDKEAFGHNTVEKEMNDLNEMIGRISNMQEVDDTEINRNHIILIGHSRGGSNAIIAAAENDKVKQLITLAAFKDYEKTWRRFYDFDMWEKEGVLWRPNKYTGEKLPLYYELYNNYLVNKEAFNIKKAIKSMKKPFILHHGIDDEFIPFEEAISMKRWNKDINLHLMPYCNHNFGAYHPYSKGQLPDDWLLLCRFSVDFIQRNLDQRVVRSG